MKRWILFVVCCAAGFAFPAEAAQGAKRAASAVPASPATKASVQGGIPEEVRRELAAVGRILANNAAGTIMPNITSKVVTPDADGGYVAGYVAVDVSNIRTEVFPSTESGAYLGSIRYVESWYECPGQSEAEALQAECYVARTRLINELVRYEQGQWHY